MRLVRADADVELLLESFDDATLSGDQARAMALTRQLWEVRRQVPEVITRRVIGGRSRVPALAFELLALFAGARSATHLRRIAGEKSVPDIVRFGAQRRAGWPERTEARRRLVFLGTLGDPDATLMLATEQATDGWPPNGEIFGEVLGYLAALPSERRRDFTVRAGREFGSRAAWLLQALLHVNDSATQRLALSELVRLRDSAAVGSLGRLARTALDAEVRAEAEAAARRLRLQVVDRGKTAGERQPLPPLERAFLSAVDASGSQAIAVVRRREGRARLIANFLYKDTWGIKDAFGLASTVGDQVEDMIEGLGAASVELIEVSLAAVRGLLAGAVEVNAATSSPIPAAFELWEPLVHESYPPEESEPIIVPELDDMPYAGRQDLIRASGRLLAHSFFRSWMFDPGEMSQALAGALPPRRVRLTDRQYGPLIERLATPPVRALLRQRLRRQAWLLGQKGDPAARDLALATAISLARAGPADLEQHPFLRALVQRSVLGALAALCFF